MDYAVKNIYGKTNNKSVSVRVPGSKSITARAMLISALAEGESVLYGAQFSDDCATFLNCLKELGIDCRTDGQALRIKGCGGKLSVTRAKINVGSAGTAGRFLPAVLALNNGEITVCCSEQMKKRPVAPLVKALESLGAKFTFLEKENSFPFIIRGTSACADGVTADISKSSQFLSALLMASVCADRPYKIKTVGSHGLDYAEMTVKMMRSFGAQVVNDGAYAVSGKYTARNYTIEPDVSAGAYFYAINRVLGTRICVEGISSESMQGDMKFIELIENFDGGRVNMGAYSDQALTLSAIAPYFSGPTEICGIAHIRGQECDRIRAMYENLTAMGVKCEEREDGIKIYPSQPKPARIRTFGDHRVAMSFAVTGLRADGVVIEDAEVCSKTFKDYFSVLDGVIAELT